MTSLPNTNTTADMDGARAESEPGAAAMLSDQGGSSQGPRSMPTAGTATAPSGSARPSTTEVLDKQDLAVLRGIRAQDPIGYSAVTRAIEEGDPSGLENVTFGAVRGKPAIMFRDQRGREQVMSLPAAQWLQALRHRSGIRAEAVRRAEAEREKAERTQRLAPTMQRLLNESSLMSDPSVAAAMSYLFEQSPDDAMQAAMNMRISERADAQAAQAQAKAMVIQHRGQIQQQSMATLGAVIESRISDIGERVGRVTRNGDVPAEARQMQSATLMRDARVMETAWARLAPLAARGEQHFAPNPIAVHGANAADDMLELISRGIYGERLEPLPFSDPMRKERQEEIMAQVARLSRDMGFAGALRPEDRVKIVGRMLSRAGHSVPPMLQHEAMGNTGEYSYGQGGGQPGGASIDRARELVQTYDEEKQRVTQQATMAEDQRAAEQEQAMVKRAREAYEFEAKRRNDMIQSIQSDITRLEAQAEAIRETYSDVRGQLSKDGRTLLQQVMEALRDRTKEVTAMRSEIMELGANVYPDPDAVDDEQAEADEDGEQ